MKRMIWKASLAFAVVIAVAGSPLLLQQITADDTVDYPQVLVTGTTVAASANAAEAPVEASEPLALPATEAGTIAVETPALVEPPSDLMSITRKGETIALVGAVTRIEAHDDLVAAAKRAFPTFAIDARLVQEPMIEEGREDAALVAIAALSRLAEGRAEISGTAINVTGRALYAQIPAILSARLADEVPEGWTVSLEIVAPDGATANGGAQCQQSVVARLADDQISFAVAAAILQPDAEPLLDELADILGQCPNVAVEVAGHTDSDGSEAANRRLSQERAAAVRQALARRGVEAERLSAVGYGQAQPIAPNDTPENKARNRRIELIVID
jgi:OOP family OmpA-OmpF porin